MNEVTLKSTNTLCYREDKITVSTQMESSLIVSDQLEHNAARIKNNHHRQKYAKLPEPVVFMTVSASTSGRINEKFLLLLFLHVHRDASVLAGELSEESTHFRFIRVACLDTLKGSIGLMLTKVSGYYFP
jgi:hypothetical protein